MARGYWLGAILCLGLTATLGAKAQEVEELQVTGERPLLSPLTSNGPLTIVSAEEIDRDGSASLEQLLTKLPGFGFQGVNSSQSAGGYGVNFVDLHNLNFNRTLTLIDGQRMVLSGIKTDEAVDYNNIPTALIDHVEIYGDGSQPRFGADAVSGLVNVVLKQNFQGWQTSGSAGIAGAGDATGQQLDATWGGVGENGGLVINLGEISRGPVLQANRAWSRLPVASIETVPNGGSVTNSGLPATPGGHAVSADGVVNALVLGPGQSRPFDPATDNDNPASQTDLQAGTARWSANLLAHYDLGPDLRLTAQSLFTDRRATALAPPQILGLAGTAKHPDGFIIPADNPFNPFGEDVLLERVLSETGPQTTTTEATTWRLLLGVDGKLGAGIDWTATYDHGVSNSLYRTDNAINLTRADQTLGLGPEGCPASQGCVLADYFGPNSLSPQAINYIRYADVSRSAYREEVAQVTATTLPASLPAGDLRLRIGAEWRYEHGKTSLDPVTLAGDQAAADNAPTSGGETMREAFVDLDAPLLSDRPGIKALTADASARYSDVDPYGRFPTWKAALNYAADAGLRLRATIGTSERIPAITEAYGGVSANLVAVDDPCDPAAGQRSNPVVDANCRAQGLGPAFKQNSALIDIASGGNPHLRPERARNLTLGAVWTPPALPGVSLAVDWYRVKIADAIDSLADTDADYIPDACYASAGLSSPLCPLITRTPGGPNAGQISRILGLDENIGDIKTDGLEIDLGWQREIGGLGRVTAKWDSGVLAHYLVHNLGSPRAVDYAGHFASLVGVGSYARLKSNLSLGWSGGGWSAEWTGRYVGGATLLGATPGTPGTSAPGITYHDLVFGYAHDPIEVTFGIDNLFDQAPPFLLDGVSNTDLNTYDVVGRHLFLRATARF